MADQLQTATFLAGLCYFLAHNPPVYQRLQDEVRTAFLSSQDMTLAKLAQLTYLQAVVREGLRMFPPAADIFPRIIPKGGETIFGQYLPEGVSLATPLQSGYSAITDRSDDRHVWALAPLLHHTRTATSPTRMSSIQRGGLAKMPLQTRDFEPPNPSDRAIVPVWAKCKLPHPLYRSHFNLLCVPGQGLALSSGLTDCSSLAAAEIRLLLANLVFHFDMDILAEDKHWLDACRVFIGWEKIPLRFELSPRTTEASQVNETQSVAVEIKELVIPPPSAAYPLETPLITAFNTSLIDKKQAEVQVLERSDDEDLVQPRRVDVLA